jgi:hypothetical protein
MDLAGERSSMSFVMPAGYTADNLPKPDNTSVVIGITEAEYVAESVSGLGRDEAIRHHADKLAKHAGENKGSPTGEPSNTWDITHLTSYSGEGMRSWFPLTGRNRKIK